MVTLDAHGPRDAGVRPDALAVDATIGDTGATDAGRRTICDRPVAGRIWCSGFEGVPSEEFSATFSGPAGTVEISDFPRWAGEHSGTVTSRADPVGGAYRFQRDRLSVPASGSIHVSFWIWRAAATPTARVEVLRLTNASNTSRLLVFVDADGAVSVGHHSPFQSGSVDGPFVIPAESWTCVRFEMFAETVGDLRLWGTDDTGLEAEYEVTWSPSAPDMSGGPYVVLWAGMWNSDVDARLVYDDISIGTTPQPCF